MNFLEAMECLKNKRSVRRECWPENCYLTIEDGVIKVKTKLNEYISSGANDPDIEVVALNSDDWVEYYDLMTLTEAFEDFLTSEDKFKIVFKDADGNLYTIVKKYGGIASLEAGIDFTKQELQSKSFYAV